MAIKIKGTTIIDDSFNVFTETGFLSDGNSAMRPRTVNTGACFLQRYNTDITDWETLLVASNSSISCFRNHYVAAPYKYFGDGSGLTNLPTPAWPYNYYYDDTNTAVRANGTTYIQSGNGLSIWASFTSGGISLTQPTTIGGLLTVNAKSNSYTFYSDDSNSAMRASAAVFGQIGATPGNNDNWQAAFVGKFEIFPYWSAYNRLMLQTSFIKCDGGLAINTSQPMPFHGGDGILTTTPVYISDSGGLTWSFSSRRNKTDIKDIEIVYKKILNLRPVLYKDLWVQHPDFDEETNRIEIDKQMVGLIAEEVYEEIPEICEFGYHYLDQEEVCDHDECGNEIQRRRSAKECAEKQPINVNYNRLPVLIVGFLKEMNADIESLKEEIQSLKASLQTP